MCHQWSRNCLPLPKHPRSLQVLVGFVLLVTITFICMFCRSLFVPSVLFHLVILLFVLLWFTDSVYPLGIFKSSYTHHFGRVKTKTQISSLTHLQLLNNVIIIKTNVLLSQMVTILLKIFGCLAPKDWKKN